MSKVDTREVGLEIGATIFKYFLDTEYLHYGYFSDGLAVETKNLAEAQVRYANLLKSTIPAAARRILDVGCGTGRFALELRRSGLAVDCVSPGALLTEHARRLLDQDSRIYQCKFEDLVTDRKYDVVLFSESFQYIDPHRALAQAMRVLEPGGHVLICDIFKTDRQNRSKLGGGHDLATFKETVRDYPLTLVREQDITRETAGTIDLANRLSLEVLKPTYHLILRVMDDRYPRIGKFLRWKYKQKLARMEAKHFSGERTGANFMRDKRYMLYLFERT